MRELGSPEVVPKRIVSLIRYTRIKTRLGQFPTLFLADFLGEPKGIVVRIRVTKSFLDGVKQVLPVEKSNRSLRFAQRKALKK
jgi:hypothetical protein